MTRSMHLCVSPWPRRACSPARAPPRCWSCARPVPRPRPIPRARRSATRRRSPSRPTTWSCCSTRAAPARCAARAASAPRPRHRAARRRRWPRSPARSARAARASRRSAADRRAPPPGRNVWQADVTPLGHPVRRQPRRPRPLSRRGGERGRRHPDRRGERQDRRGPFRPRPVDRAVAGRTRRRRGIDDQGQGRGRPGDACRSRCSRRSPRGSRAWRKASSATIAPPSSTC